MIKLWARLQLMRAYDDRGATAVEYGIIVAAIAIAVGAAAWVLGPAIVRLVQSKGQLPSAAEAKALRAATTTISAHAKQACGVDLPVSDVSEDRAVDRLARPRGDLGQAFGDRKRMRRSDQHDLIAELDPADIGVRRPIGGRKRIDARCDLLRL